uniref:Methyltransferase domain-containing protein n=1 Tax=Pycnococcus provasolii TaxID=41880 RepID=A0A7S2ARH3_9CHLO|mmetsp:Transcript_1545/g.3450  ORF Transcript_1545/g.3450 Transcript_1545/m.3450 type:complete len:395 (+) Transcript_1545:28-1212(+)
MPTPRLVRSRLSSRARTHAHASSNKHTPASVAVPNLAAAAAVPTNTQNAPLGSPAIVAAGSAAAIAAAGLAVKRVLDTPAREYKEGAQVGKEYDAWHDEGILEYYWGEHIHLGYYSDEERAEGYKKKDFKQAKYDFIDEMFHWGTQPIDTSNVKTVLDVGCGIGGTSRYLAKKLLPNATVTGITISEKQVERATQLAKEQDVPNAKFELMDALNMEYPDNSFDMVWACESGEHMPDKTKYVNEMIRVLKPGGRLIIATWCQRDNLEELKASGTSEEVMANAYENLVGFTDEEKERLDFLYREWAHPYFISYEEYARICERSGVVKDVTMADWAKETLPSWRHSIWVGVWDPWIVVFKGPKVWYKTIREIVTLERMHRAFDDGLLTYGMISCTKK